MQVGQRVRFKRGGEIIDAENGWTPEKLEGQLGTILRVLGVTVIVEIHGKDWQILKYDVIPISPLEELARA